MQRALRVADRLAQDGIAVEVVDLRSLRPLDVETVAESVRKTNRVLVAEEGWSTYGVGAELAARIQRVCFDDLDAPVERVGQAEVPMPYSKPLELAALPLESKIEAAARSLLAECGPVEVRPMSEELTMPRLSDTMEQGTIGRWLKREGESFREGDVIAEIETDKATMDFQAYDDGTMLQILVGDGESAALGAPIAIVGAEGEEIPSTRRRPRQPSQTATERAPTADAPAEAAACRGGGSPRRRQRRRRPTPPCGRARSRAAWPTRPASTCARWPARAPAPTAASSRPTSSAHSTAASRPRRPAAAPAAPRPHRLPRAAPAAERRGARADADAEGRRPADGRVEGDRPPLLRRAPRST